MIHYFLDVFVPQHPIQTFINVLVICMLIAGIGSASRGKGSPD